MTQRAKLSPEESARLRENLARHFDGEELRTLCFDLGVDYDNLRGEGKEAKARELVAFLGRLGRIPALIKKCTDLRSNIDWETATYVPPPEPIRIQEQEIQPYPQVEQGTLAPLPVPAPVDKVWKLLRRPSSLAWAGIALLSVLVLVVLILGREWGWWRFSGDQTPSASLTAMEASIPTQAVGTIALPPATPPPTTPPPPPECTPGDDFKEPSMCVVSVSVQINEDIPKPVGWNEQITLTAGDALRLVNLHYCTSGEVLADSVAGEAYLFPDGVETYDYGLFTRHGAHIRAGCNLVGDFEGSWIMEQGQHRVVIALMHYFSEPLTITVPLPTRCAVERLCEVDDRFYINLNVIPP